MAGPLEGYRILDLTQMISGPLATRILADQGADVLKIEPKSGDLTRGLGGAARKMSPIFATVNRNKRSLALDLKQAAGVETVKRLAESADVFVQNFRPGAIERMGLSADVLRELNPRLIYVSISGFGERGPYAEKRVYDPVIQALSGLASIQGGSGGRPRMLRLIVPDKLTGVTAAQAMTAALLARERTGQAQHVRLSMLDAVISFLWPEGMARHTFIGTDIGTTRPPDARDLVFETRDGFMTAGTVAHREWVAFCKAMKRESWLEDSRFRNAAGLVKYADARLELMAEVLALGTTRENCERLDLAGVPCAPILTRDELLEHPQIVENRIVVESDHPNTGRMRQARPAERFEATPSELRWPAPLLGEHTDAVLAAAGLTPAEIERLRDQAVIL